MRCFVSFASSHHQIISIIMTIIEALNCQMALQVRSIASSRSIHQVSISYTYNTSCDRVTLTVVLLCASVSRRSSVICILGTQGTKCWHWSILDRITVASADRFFGCLTGGCQNTLALTTSFFLFGLWDCMREYSWV